MVENKKSLLRVDNFSVSFQMYERGLKQKKLDVISDLSISVNAGEIVAIAGASGSGKSILAHGILGLLPGNAIVHGDIFFMDEKLDERKMKELRGSEISLIPQSITYLDPLMIVGKQVQGMRNRPKRDLKQKKVFDRLGLQPETNGWYPFQLSGGMARRVLFSTAIMSDASLIIADEPTPGMHMAQAIEALKILRELADMGKGVMLITHDLDLAVNVADKIAVFYAGTTVEETSVSDFLSGPSRLRHPYSRALWGALPQNGFLPIEGTQPYAGNLPDGCLFAPRCNMRTMECEIENPPVQTLRGGNVRCLHAT